MPLTGSDFGNGRLAIRRNASSEGALRQMSQCWSGGYAPTTRKSLLASILQMPRTRWQNRHVAWPDFHLVPVLAA